MGDAGGSLDADYSSALPANAPVLESAAGGQPDRTAIKLVGRARD
jgi:hypothetical protein